MNTKFGGGPKFEVSVWVACARVSSYHKEHGTPSR